MNRLVLSPAHLEQMIDHAAACLPEEACGILAGADGLVHAVLPVTNHLHSPVRFQMDFKEQWRAFQWLEAQHLEMLAFFHSHPNGPAHPSETDLKEFYYPGVFSLILSPGVTGWQAGCFKLDNGKIETVDLIVQPTDGLIDAAFPIN
ncbi:MAG TPA: M67 family metallopeptidase [Anaerolineaceae bacterium]|nr:M67 family metallopeptidase [Anaerolineaceae bacterium]HPN50108.1 M67 family metallopeptidase [Anaerolineaceae bacterium]